MIAVSTARRLRVPTSVFAAALSVAAAVLAPCALQAQSLPGGLLADNNVRVILESGGNLYVGGTFTYLGHRTGYGVPVDATSGAVAAAFPEVNAAVQVAISDGAGGYYIGGDFTSVGGVARERVARVLSNGTVDGTFNPGANGTVRALALSGTTLYLGGFFTSVGGVTRNRIAAVNATTGALDGTFNPGAGGTVWALAVSGSTLYVGGDFTSVGGGSRNRIAAVDATSGALDGTFNPSPNGVVYALAVSGSRLYLGGDFAQIGGAGTSNPTATVRNALAAVDATTGVLDAAFNANVSNLPVSPIVRVLVLSGTKLYFGGSFTRVGDVSRVRLAAVDVTTGAVDGTFNAGASSTVLALALSGSTLYVGGNFSDVITGVSYSYSTRKYIAAVNATTGALDETFNPSASAPVYALAVSGTKLYVGGNFVSVGGVARNRLARVLSNGTVDPAFNPSPSGTVFSLLLSGTKLYFGGFFSTVGGVSRNRIAAVDATTGALDGTFNPDANDTVWSLALSGSTLYLGGQFSTVGGVSRNRIAAVNATTGALNTTFNPSANGTVRKLLLSGSKLYLSGEFTSMGVSGTVRNYIAAVDATSGALDGTFNPGANGTVNALALSGTKLYLGGAFTSVGGGTRNYIAAVNATSGVLDGTFNPSANSAVETLLLNSTTLYLGGAFSSIGGAGTSNSTATTRTNVAAVNATSGVLDAGFRPTLNNSVLALALNGANIYLGGVFTTINGVPQTNFATVTSTTLPVELAAFSATADGPAAVLAWTTQSETNNAGFRIEAQPVTAVPGAAWQVLGTVAGQGTTSEATRYRFRSEPLAPGRYRVRLAQVDLDGTTTLSPVVELTLEAARALVLTALAPNPARSAARVSFTVAEAGRAVVTVYDALGRAVAVVFDGQAQPGAVQQALIPAETLTAGTYVVRLVQGGQVRTQPLTVVR